MRHKLISLLLIVCIFLMMPMSASAQYFDPDCVGSVSVTLKDPEGKKQIAGAELSLYYVAAVSLDSDNKLRYTLTDEFKNCGFALDDPALSAKLETFVKEHSVFTKKLVTDTSGTLTFTNLPLGLYFVRQTNTVAGYAPCKSFLVTVPNHNADGYVYDVNASPKTDVERLTDITVKKVWNTDASTKAADQVTVQLLRDGVIVKTATLNAKNNWQVVYADMPESDAYSIVEINVPSGYTATYSQRGYVFVVTNSTSLIQTGQLIWPIPVLAMTGLCLLIIGTIVLNKTRDKNA